MNNINIFGSSKYKFTSVKENYEDYSSGRVIYGAPEATNFPVRLVSEIFLRCNDYLSKKRNNSLYNIYDPFCGVGYSLTVLGFLHGSQIKNIFASDVDKNILEFAHKNLSLLNNEGIDIRIVELTNYFKEYGKLSHKEALKSAERLKEVVKLLNIGIFNFQFNILTEAKLPELVKDIDIVIADVPYGKLAEWESLDADTNPIQVTLNKIKDRLSDISVVAIVMNKKQEIKHEGYNRIEKFNIGKRKVVILKPENN